MLEQAHAEALACPVVLGDERPVEAPRRIDDPLQADGGDGSRHGDAVRLQGPVLRDLRQLQPQGAPVIHDAASMSSQPVEHGGR